MIPSDAQALDVGAAGSERLWICVGFGRHYPPCGWSSVNRPKEVKHMTVCPQCDGFAKRQKPAATHTVGIDGEPTEAQAREIATLREQIDDIRAVLAEAVPGASGPPLGLVYELASQRDTLTAALAEARKEREEAQRVTGDVARTFSLMSRYKTGGYGAMVEDEGGKWIEAKAVEDLLEDARPDYRAAAKAEQGS